ncbi:MAG: DNA polymerase III subunit gamma/tau [Phycisphaerales bacterium]|nr:DNA polymerase III subunit gamma/tau [Phycisphaerales bacterium]
MTYTVLARRYRSRSFDEVVGQETIARTLQTALDNDRIGHAYLFCGTRGVGKTTMARLLAAAINLAGSADGDESIRDAIMRGDDLDVIEIDGASNRGVQEARDLIANAGLSPARSDYKIYIIDEVHMLTTESFNTLLKTMEEPPEHVKFILCTTEPNKVLQTIQSRCQRFDFRPIPSSMIVEHLQGVLQQEGVEADTESIARVAELGNGSMRDALSVLERLLATGTSTLEAGAVDRVLGLPDQEQVGGILAAILDGDPGEALARAGGLLSQGTSLDQAMDCLIETLRSLLIMVTCGQDSDLIEVTDATRDQLAAQAARLDAPGVLHLLALCEHASRAARLSASARAVFDTTIVRMALAENLADVQSILSGTAPATRTQKKTQREPAPAVKRPSAKPAAKASSKASAKASRPVEPPPAATPKPSPSTAPASTSAVGDKDELWARVNELATTPSARAKIASFEPVDFTDGVLQLKIRAAVGGDFLRTQVESLNKMITRAAGTPARVKILGDEPETEAGTDPGSESRGEVRAEPVPKAKPGKITEAIREDPGVRLAEDLLGAVIIDVAPRDDTKE